MPYRIALLPAALEHLAGLSETDQRRLTQQIGLLQTNPRPPKAKTLPGAGGLFRLRVGNCRIIYSVDDEQHLALIVKIARPRKMYPGS